MRIPAAITAVILGVAPATASAQATISGQASVAVSAFPNETRTPELRSRIFAETTIRAGSHLRFELGGFGEGLLAGGIDERGHGMSEIDKASVEITAGRVDVLAGFTRAVWGRLDEVQPSDVINPLDFSKFFFDSREAARMAVGLVRARVHLSKSATLEAVLVPRFRRGRFDRLDEPTSPFNPGLVPQLRVSVARPPDDVWGQMQGGGRFSTTIGRVDWSVGAYRGFRPLPVYKLSYVLSGLPAAPVPQLLIEGTYPRFTMASVDFETAFSRWALRGEIVASDDDAVQARGTPVSASGRSVQAGLGADRSIAGYRVMAEMVWRTATLDTPSLPYDPLTTAPAVFDRRSLSAVGIVERKFAREIRLLRAFGIYDLTARNGLVRGLGAIRVREAMWLEGTVGWFPGRRIGFLGPFVDDDFVSVRLTQTF